MPFCKRALRALYTLANSNRLAPPSPRIERRRPAFEQASVLMMVAQPSYSPLYEAPAYGASSSCLRACPLAVLIAFTVSVRPSISVRIAALALLRSWYGSDFIR